MVLGLQELEQMYHDEWSHHFDHGDFGDYEAELEFEVSWLTDHVEDYRAEISYLRSSNDELTRKNEELQEEILRLNVLLAAHEATSSVHSGLLGRHESGADTDPEVLRRETHIYSPARPDSSSTLRVPSKRSHSIIDADTDDSAVVLSPSNPASPSTLSVPSEHPHSVIDGSSSSGTVSSLSPNTQPMTPHMADLAVDIESDSSDDGLENESPTELESIEALDDTLATPDTDTNDLVKDVSSDSQYQEKFSGCLEPWLAEGVREFLENATSSSVAEGVLEVMYKLFEDREVAISKRTRNELVIPSGTLNSPLGIRMHYPTYNSDLRGRKTFDISNPSMRILAKKGLDSIDVMVLDTFARRENVPPRGKPFVLEGYPENLKKVHLDFSDWVFENSQAKVWMIAGAPNRSRYRLRSSELKVSFKVELNGVTVEGSVEFKTDGKIRRIIVFVAHPSCVFNSLYKGWDEGYNLVAALMGYSTDRTYMERFGHFAGIKKGRASAFDVLNRVVKFENESGVRLDYDELPEIVWDYARLNGRTREVLDNLRGEIGDQDRSYASLLRHLAYKDIAAKRLRLANPVKTAAGIQRASTTKREKGPLVGIVHGAKGDLPTTMRLRCPTPNCTFEITDTIPEFLFATTVGMCGA